MRMREGKESSEKDDGGFFREKMFPLLVIFPSSKDVKMWVCILFLEQCSDVLADFVQVSERKVSHFSTFSPYSSFFLPHFLTFFYFLKIPFFTSSLSSFSSTSYPFSSHLFSSLLHSFLSFFPAYPSLLINHHFLTELFINLSLDRSKAFLFLSSVLIVTLKGLRG